MLIKSCVIAFELSGNEARCSLLLVYVWFTGKASRKNQKWRGPDENIRANLRQYGAECFYVDVMVSDAAKSVWRKGALFDAIITDRMFLLKGFTPFLHRTPAFILLLGFYCVR